MIKYKKITIMGMDAIERDNGEGTISFIPVNESNSDYLRYLRWLENPDADESGTL